MKAAIKAGRPYAEAAFVEGHKQGRALGFTEGLAEGKRVYDKPAELVVVAPPAADGAEVPHDPS